MKQLQKAIALAAAALLGGVAGAAHAALSLPLTFSQNDILWNLRSYRGMPISVVSNSATGSDGRMPLANDSYGSVNPGGANQFRGLVFFGGSCGLASNDWLAVAASPYLDGSHVFSATVAAQMRLPVGRDDANNISLVLRRVQIGAPYLGRQVSCLYGSVIAVPDTDESTAALTNVVPAAYWLPEPYTTNDHVGASYYWSPNAGKVYAIQPGPITITWRKATPYTAATAPTNYVNLNGTTSFETNGGNVYLLYTATYLVSGVPCKPTRKMYWTEGSFLKTGKMIPLSTRVSAVKVVYNAIFPENVASNEVVTASTPEMFIPGLTDRTFWFDTQNANFHARNLEGRVFVELLGDARADGRTREPLGYELVDVIREPTPVDVTVYLGERLVPPMDMSVDDLTPSPPTDLEAMQFMYQQVIQGADIVGNVQRLYAAKETLNLNDFRMHWMETGLCGIQWPSLYGRYAMVWPSDERLYAHYVRPVAATAEEAQQTAVQLDLQMSPYIQYQDPFTWPRARIVADGKFYTWLDATVPAHRTLLRFVNGNEVAFERVFSWLDTNLKITQSAQTDAARIAAWAGTVAANLSAWTATNGMFAWSDPLSAPRVVSESVSVGQRLTAPGDEPGSGSEYWGGHINTSIGTAYNSGVYIDPLGSGGFAAAQAGAIIPVNADPLNNQLEVWWFRPDSTLAGHNAANTVAGFPLIHWPSVVGRYTVQWPEFPREIVLASKLGSGTLSTYEAAGSIYYQNDRTLDGYNPNEEHAVMSGGSVYATRDDLNITNGADYSSAPYVLLDWLSNSVPHMTVFKVLREKPEAGYVFDYMVPAGSIMQPPPPLTFLSKPVVGSGDSAVNYNTEVAQAGGDLPGGWDAETSPSGRYGYYNRFTYKDRQDNIWVYRGPHAGLPALQVGTYVAASNRIVALTNAVAVASQAFSLTLHASRQPEFLEMRASGLPSWLSLSGLTLSGTPGTDNVGISSSVRLVVEDLLDQSAVTGTVAITVAPTNGTAVMQGGLAITCSNRYSGVVTVYSNRAPFLAVSPDSTNSFAMQYYYKTEASFAFPSLAIAPAVGTIVPYLRPVVGGAYEGTGSSSNDTPLSIVYRPYWPERDPADASKAVPIMPYGYTLTEAVSQPAILPGIRNWKTARMIYQQSVARDIEDVLGTTQLFDPTRQKTASLGAAGVPGGVKTETYQGKTYFPGLPPHLGTRLYFDPAMSSNGCLVLKGEYVASALGESYLLLNVLRGADLAAAKGLCPASPAADKTRWDAAVDGLSTVMETFHEDPDMPGSYVPDESLSYTVGVGDLPWVRTDIGDNTAVDSYALSSVGPGEGYVVLLESGGTAFTSSGDPVAMHVIRVGGSLYGGSVKVIAADNPLSELTTFQHTADLAGKFDEFEYEWKIASPVDGVPPAADATMSRYLALASGTDLPRYVLGGAGIQALADNYITMRYRPVNTEHPLYGVWSDWTTPQLAEGWIKRVLAGINPFSQRLTDLFNNSVDTSVSLLTQAGRRWEGDVALNMDTINDYGLIEIYETVLRRGRALSIESGYNYGPANDALLLAAGYLSDLYKMVGDEAWADAANPTIGIGTADQTYGDIATALFAFKGQEPSLLEEELALLRGRDDFLQPGCKVSPVYNRLVWNYTRGIDAGEVIYALNYNIQPAPDSTSGSIGASDAAYMYPQGHGDAYGHYLTALKGYYSLLLNSCFDWVPRSEAVTVLGQPVQVDYQDERKFASAAASVARAGRQVFDLTWRRDYSRVHSTGWGQFGYVHTNPRVTYTTGGATSNTASYWGLDHWATRTGQGGYLNWVVGNAILPDVDDNESHTGIQIVDRTTVPELQELVTQARDLQTAMDNAEGGLSPLGLPQDALAFDIDPSQVVGMDSGTHFEQIYGRARTALNNAVASFDDAKDVTRLMRSEEDSLTALRQKVASQEQAYLNALIELYGTPYSDDMGAGKTYDQDYTGPDLLHYMYVDRPESDFTGEEITGEQTFRVDTTQLPTDWGTRFYTDMSWVTPSTSANYLNGTNNIEYTLSTDGFFSKPSSWSGRRASPGRIQQRISDVIAARDRVLQALGDAEGAKTDLDKAIAAYNADVVTHAVNDGLQGGLLAADEILQWIKFNTELIAEGIDLAKDGINELTEDAKDAIPTIVIAGTACGSDALKPASAAPEIAGDGIGIVLGAAKMIINGVTKGLECVNQSAHRWTEYGMGLNNWEMEKRNKVLDLGTALEGVQGKVAPIIQAVRVYDDAKRAYYAAVAEGDRIQAERETYRKQVAQAIQGYRTRDAGFRIFRNEKLERYKTLFDLAARYALLAANAYDYETGLLDTDAGQEFVAKIINARALGVVRDGEPQYAGSDTGDPGLSSALAEMKADWDVLRGRLGFNNPDAYGTTVSLRTEALRILPGSDGDSTWKDVLQAARLTDILADSDVRRHCMQIDDGSGLPVPGIVLEFSTTIAKGYNLFGQPLAAGDHAFSESSFATKIFGAGVALVGYRGMDNPTTGSSSGGTSPSDPPTWYLDPLALAATPYVYLIPVGSDSMRSPPLGDTSAVRTWSVYDVAIPMPFNIGASDFSTKQLWEASDSLTDLLFAIRKHQAFRPVSDPTVFSPSLYGDSGTLTRSQFMNNRLVGRSVWNSRWKLVIPGHTLLSDPKEGLDRLIQTVTDVKLHFVTYSYSGN